MAGRLTISGRARITLKGEEPPLSIFFRSFDQLRQGLKDTVRVHPQHAAGAPLDDIDRPMAMG
ncbi:MAG: hypothetical protein ACU0CF_07225, partial [Sagittula sp.]|uniref:hypothetical protein n=1 Tax=Sagittula sp. TaxID=2038081 RepID=UPI0040597A39